MRPRSIVFDLYGDYFRYTGGAARLAVLTELMSVFDVEPATVRVVMTRLRKDGWFDSDKDGRAVTYRLNAKSWQLLDEGRDRIFDRTFADWNRTWTQALLRDDDLSRDGRKRIETSLSWCGFGCYSGGTWFSPHDRRKRLGEMLATDDESSVTFLHAGTPSLTDDRLIAETCWDLTDLGHDYRDFIDRFRPNLAAYRRGLSGRAALVERMRLIGDYRRFPFRDPDLPDVLLPAGWRGREAHEVFLEAHDALRASAEEAVRTVESGRELDM
ncbi:PaaX family transcriptional regulator [Gordonia sp. TBRC 11910]|uniref:PaaX family transcriptional regulator n=1 Tax=Gordonia asplenii TaxID=2725283 RepID=A0A848KY95_9ACTN|nr:PaaX family transcriptional regulator C-terminal domain-containing protein [Gordonia asplenii]NMO00418.1 PaaX family transcriptional regulator [Gordonia asplenii]